MLAWPHPTVRVCNTLQGSALEKFGGLKVDLPAELERKSVAHMKLHEEAQVIGKHVHDGLEKLHVLYVHCRFTKCHLSLRCALYLGAITKLCTVDMVHKQTLQDLVR